MNFCFQESHERSQNGCVVVARGVVFVWGCGNMFADSLVCLAKGCAMSGCVHCMMQGWCFHHD